MDYRIDLPPMPANIAKLPAHRGFPVPWFVPFIDGKPEPRMAEGKKIAQAVREKRCWVCGQRLGRFFAFVIGPMCTINRVSAEPPCHVECGEFSAIACPFLNGKEMERRENDMPPAMDCVGVMIRRNPGCICLWTTSKFEIEREGRGVLFRIGNPSAVKWFAKGRKATRAEVEESIRTGYPILMDMAQSQSAEAVEALTRAKASAECYLPGRAPTVPA
jgi:hypothetical protein